MKSTTRKTLLGHDAGADQQLTSRAAAGERQANRLLVERLMPGVRTTIHYLVARDRDADDIVQLALIEVLRSSATFRGESSLELWSHRIVVRTALRYIELRNLKARRDLDDALIQDETMTSTTPETDLERTQLRRHLKALLDRLPVEQKTAILLRYVFSYTPGEIAQITETPLNTVRERLRVGRQKLRKYLVRDPELRTWQTRRDG